LLHTTHAVVAMLILEDGFCDHDAVMDGRPEVIPQGKGVWLSDEPRSFPVLGEMTLYADVPDDVARRFLVEELVQLAGAVRRDASRPP
jgi:hypothetical protein